MVNITRSIMIIFVFLLVACNSGVGIQVKNIWGRASPAVAENGAFYMILRNSGKETDRLIGIATTACGQVELHESYMTEEGAMGMRPVEGGYVEIPVGDEVHLEPGGMHVMCINKQVDFSLGKKIKLTLRFEKAGDLDITAEIKEMEE